MILDKTGWTDSPVRKAFETLDGIWSRGLLPYSLERHYFLYWFAVHQGDIEPMAEALEAHRNTIQFHFERFGFNEKSDLLRKNWRVLMEKKKSHSFEVKFLKFYQINEIKNQLRARENKTLIGLWQSGFSFQTIGAHYMLWALRNHRTKEWIQKKLGYSSHHCMRVLVTVLNPQTANGRWLAPLNPHPDEIYSRGPRNRFMQPEAAERKMAVSE
jgi:hypothetical protein